MFFSKNKLLYSFLVLILCHSSAYSLNHSKKQNPVIICLKGTCSSGKTTFINTITSEFKDLVIVDEDSIVFKRYPEAIAKRFPEQFAKISKAVDDNNLYHTLRTEDIYFKNDATRIEREHAINAVNEIQKELNKAENLTWKKEISQKITDEVLYNIQSAIQQNKNILLDAWYVTPNHIEKLYPETCVVKILIYCSLPVAYKRLLERNEEAIAKGILSKKRFVGQLLGSFRDLYDINYDPANSLEVIDKSNYYETFNRVLKTLPDRPPTTKPIFTFREISREEVEKIYINLIGALNEYNSDCLYVTPKEKYDVIINNTYSDPSATLESFKKVFELEKSYLIIP